MLRPALLNFSSDEFSPASTLLPPPFIQRFTSTDQKLPEKAGPRLIRRLNSLGSRPHMSSPVPTLTLCSVRDRENRMTTPRN